MRIIILKSSPEPGLPADRERPGKTKILVFVESETVANTISRIEPSAVEAETEFERLYARLTNAIVPETLDGADLNDPRQRALILVGVVLISGFSAVMFTTALSVLFFVSGDPLHLIAAAMALVTVFGYLGTFVYFKMRHRLLPAANMYALTTLLSTVFPCLITGGVKESPYLAMVLVVPIFLFLIAGRVRGVQWSILSSILVSGILMLEHSGVTFPQAIPEAHLPTFTLITFTTTLSLLVMGLFTYESSFESFTARLSAERSQFAHEATHDPLTGLSNRTLFYQRASEAVDYALSHKHKAAILYVDLDDFKRINDAGGHKAGDEILSLVAQRLEIAVRSIDTVARLGGDEFAVVLHGLEQTNHAYFAADKLRRVLDEPFAMGGQTICAPGSIGVAVAPDDGEDVDDLLRHADADMYREKASRQNFNVVNI
jgi:diguanylate cyclase (GGDEF)-like protein